MNQKEHDIHAQLTHDELYDKAETYRVHCLENDHGALEEINAIIADHTDAYQMLDGIEAVVNRRLR